MLPREKVGQRRPVEEVALALGKERLYPTRVAVLPDEVFQLLQALRAATTSPLVPQLHARSGHEQGWPDRRRPPADSDGDHDRRLDVEDVLRAPSTAPFSLKVDQPEVVELLAHLLPHANKARPTEIRGRRDEADDPALLRRVEHLPERPPPEVDVEVIEVLEVTAVAALDSGPQEILQYAGSSSVLDDFPL